MNPTCLGLEHTPSCGDFNRSIASTFFGCGRIPLLVRRNPKYSTYFCMKKDFRKFARVEAFVVLWSRVSTVSTLCVGDPFWIFLLVG